MSRPIPEPQFWFHSGSLPPFVGSAFCIIGGSALLKHFFHFVSICQGGRLAIAVPYIDRGLDTDGSLLHGFPFDRHDLDILIPSRSPSGLADLAAAPWRSRRIRRLAGLHAKCYAYEDSRKGAACLLGSHNLTHAAVRSNKELGVLLATSRNDTTAALIADIAERTRAGLALTSTSLFHAHQPQDERNAA